MGLDFLYELAGELVVMIFTAIDKEWSISDKIIEGRKNKPIAKKRVQNAIVKEEIIPEPRKRKELHQKVKTPRINRAKLSIQEVDLIALMVITLGMVYYDDQFINKVEKRLIKKVLKNTQGELKAYSKRMILKLRRASLEVEQVILILDELGVASNTSLYIIEKIAYYANELPNSNIYLNYLEQVKNHYNS